MRHFLLLLLSVMFCAARPAASLGQSATQPSPQRQRISVYAPAFSQKTIWILDKDGRLSAYGSTDFRMRMSLPVPAEARQHSENLSISRMGIVIFADANPSTHVLHIWSSNNYAHELTGGVQETLPSQGGGTVVTSATPAVYFSADGQRLFWFENRLTETQQGENISRTGQFLSWTSDLQGNDLRTVIRFDLPRCACETGACEETCPEIAAWAPAAGVSDFFFLTRWIPGQIETQFLETDLYQRSNSPWTAKKLPMPVEALLDAADRGETYVATIPDAGCCGWVNESADLTYVVRGEKPTTFFDEWHRFHNNDYDLSFFTSNALLSPDVTQVAYTIRSTHESAQELRLSSDGKSNPDELRAIQAALGELPRVEVVTIADPSKPRVSLAKSELIGWLDTATLLVFQRGNLLVVDVATGQTKPTDLKAEKAAWVFMR